MTSTSSSFFGKLVPGMVFSIITNDSNTTESNTTESNTNGSICRTISTYGYTEDDCQFSPSDDIYIICKDGTLMNANTPDIHLGFNISQKLCEDGTYKTFYRVLQVGFYDTEILINLMFILPIIPETSESQQVFSGILHTGSPLEPVF